MSFVKVDLSSLISVNEFDYGVQTSYFPVSLQQLEEHELFQEIDKLLNAIDPDFDQDSVFAVKTTSGIPEALYTFSLVNEEGKACLIFGVDVDEETKKNKVFLTTEDKEEDGEVITVFKAGKATVKFTKEADNPRCSVKFGKTEMSATLRLKDDQVTFNDLDNAEDLETLASLLGNYGTFGIKIVDLVRPYVKKGCKNQLAGFLPNDETRIEVEIVSWGEPVEKQFPSRVSYSILANIKYEGVAETEQGQVIKNPQAMWIADSQLSYSLLTSKPGKDGAKSWVERALEEKSRGGKIMMLIASVNTKEPLKHCPPNNLRIVPGNGNATKSLESAKAEIFPEQTKLTRKSKVISEIVDVEAEKVLAGF